jgi:hypothetical protein
LSPFVSTSLNPWSLSLSTFGCCPRRAVIGTWTRPLKDSGDSAINLHILFGLGPGPAHSRTQGPRTQGRKDERTNKGGVPEWSIGTVLKTVDGASHPWVRIPPPPLIDSSGSGPVRENGWAETLALVLAWIADVIAPGSGWRRRSCRPMTTVASPALEAGRRAARV